MKKGIASVLIILVMLLGACSNKPSDVSQEFWEEAIQTVLYIDSAMEQGDLIDTEVTGKLITDFNDKSDKESEINQDIIKLSMASITYRIALLSDQSGEEEQKEYNEIYKGLEKTFGKSNLKSSNYNEGKILNEITERKEKEKEKSDDRKYAFMNNKDTTLYAKEVQFDMPNNLDKKFYIEGTLEICDYFNYGFTNEEGLFCGQLTPFDGGYSDSWYLYFGRESFKNYYDFLINFGEVDVMVVAEIPSGAYKRGQGNMARVRAVQTYEEVE